jgi:preprotein translocase SecE subunit
MAEKENKAVEEAAAKPAKKEKDKKPSFIARAGAWLKTVRAECKKVTWASWDSVKQNSIVVIVTSLVFAVFLGVLDFVFAQAISGLTNLFRF